jgi:hypothetical protein
MDVVQDQRYRTLERFVLDQVPEVFDDSESDVAIGSIGAEHEFCELSPRRIRRPSRHGERIHEKAERAVPLELQARAEEGTQAAPVRAADAFLEQTSLADSRVPLDGEDATLTPSDIPDQLRDQPELLVSPDEWDA